MSGIRRQEQTSPLSGAAAIAETTRLQARAAEPFGSRWVSANAGTGKTHVLVQRVLRLLLAGAKPDTILCLTYTNAAAAEMENRLFAHLSTWAVKREDELLKALTRLLGPAPDAATLQLARTLFATTLETAGGLKVQTIHSFCERLLRRFPLEADISPNSALLDEAASRELKRESIDQVLRKAAKRPDSRLGRALTTVVAMTTEDQFNGLVDETLSRRGQIRALSRGDDDNSDPFAGAAERLYAAFNLLRDDKDGDLRAELAAVLGDDQIDALYEHLNTGSGNALKTAERLMIAKHAPDERARAEALRTAFLTQRNTPVKSMAAKGLFEAQPQLMQQLLDAQEQFVTLWQKVSALRVVRASEALLRLSSEIFNAYSKAKVQRAQLDFDDLIEKTNALLHKSGGAEWVLYKLDSGLDHILVDEAQDTSPDQWRLISKLTEEFFAGKGSHEDELLPRTVFAVGDEKQSIYSFQGAQPKLFAGMRMSMEEQAGRIGHELPLIPLTLSFRSTSAVLNGVDQVFSDRQKLRGITFGDEDIHHGAVREGEHGLIEIWDLERAEPVEKSNVWDPLADLAKPEDPKEKLAERIALTIRGWLDNKEWLSSQQRPVEPGDILILVRKRHPFTQPMIRALKRHDIPAAGADRMKIAEQIAVEDLMALGDFLLLPEDDLSLASVLKSPLFGLTDDDLYLIRRDPDDENLVSLREDGSERVKNIPLWWALKQARDKGEHPLHAEAYEQLARWRMRADKVPPYELFAGILDINGGREKLTARLGSEAGDAINEFLSIALAFDDGAPPSLQEFLTSVRRNPIEIKRDMEKGVNEVRLMTVHGAKGLEAEIVFMPDTTNMRSNASAGRIQPLPAGEAHPPGTPDHMIWCLSGSDDVPQVAQIKQTKKDAEQEEYNRLLYVAMTRARDRLYVCGWLANQKVPEACWYARIQSELEEHLVEERLEDGLPVWRYERGEASRPDGPAATARRTSARPELAAPAWMEEPAPPHEKAAQALTPSSLLPEELLEHQTEAVPIDADDLTRERLQRNLAMLRGTLVHALLEHLPALPEREWEAAARRVSLAEGHELTDEQREDIVEEALRVLRQPEFAQLFEANSRAETSFNAQLPQLGKSGQSALLSGQIDRLVVGEREILVIDYKTNREVPASVGNTPAAYVAQLAAYRMAMRPLFAGKSIRCGLLWTLTPSLMWLPDDRLDAMELELPKLV